jgi:hypothetical protein
MRSDRDVEDALRAWMRNEEPAAADELIDRVAQQLPARSQRSATWWAIQRFTAVAAAAVVVVGVWIGIGAALSGGDGLGGLAISTLPLASPPPLTYGSGALEPGTYTVGADFPVELTFEVPDGFDACPIDPHEQGLCARTRAEAGLTFVIVDNLVDDPCSPDPRPADPPIGPTVDDLVQGLSNLQGLSAKPGGSVTVDGLPARTLTLTAVATSECPSTEFSGETWIVSSARTNGVAIGERNELFVMDVQGQRLMIAIAYQGRTPTWAIEAMREIVGTVRFSR